MVQNNFPFHSLELNRRQRRGSFELVVLLTSQICARSVNFRWSSVLCTLKTSEVFSSHIIGNLQRFGEWAVGLDEGLGVGFSVFPHVEEDADPFEGEGADGGLVFHAGGFVGFVEGFGRRCLLGAPATGSLWLPVGCRASR